MLKLQQSLKAVFFVCLSSGILLGQAQDGNLVGTVLDPTGAAVPKAAVEVTNVSTNVLSTTATNTEGQYQFLNLLVGTYKLKVTAKGFSTYTLGSLKVDLNKTSTANVKLAFGQVTTTVEVEEAPALIDTTTSQIAANFQEREAIDAPASSLPLGVLNLSLLGAGVASSGGYGLGDGPSVGGQRPRNNNYVIEGVDNNRLDVTGHNVDVPNEAVQEFSMLQNNFSAEFGNGTGGQFSTILRSGTNELHGSAFEYLQNRNLNAIDQSYKRAGIFSLPRYDSNLFGGSVGGPILKNKLFYYGLFQYNPVGEQGIAGASIYAPTAAGYSTLATIPGVSQTNLNVLKQYLPAAASSDGRTTTVGGVSIPLGIVPVTLPSFTNTKEWLVSIDYDISDVDKLRGRYVRNFTSGFNTATLPALPAFFLAEPYSSMLLAVSEFHTFSPALLNEFRFGYSRYNADVPAGNFQFPGLDTFPNIQIEQDLNVQLGPDTNAPQSTIINEYQLVDNVSWRKGNHYLKFGWEGRKYIAPQTFTQRVRGDYDYSTLERYLLDQNPDILAERNVGGAPYDGNQVNNYFFINDDYHFRSNLTFNLGVRYEYKGIPKGDRLQALNAIASVPGLLTFGVPQAQTTNFVPRIGVAYSPGKSGHTSIRAGFGLAYDKYFDNLGLLSTPPQVSSTVDVNPAPVFTGFLANGGILPSTAGVNCTTAQECRDATSAYIPDQKLPYSIQWTVGVQHVFYNDYTLEVRYLGTRGVHLYTQDRINDQAIVNPNRYLPTFFTAPTAAQLAGLTTTLGDLTSIDTIAPRWQQYFDNNYITSFEPRGNSIYNGLAIELTRRFARNLLFKGAYTWSHNLDDSTADLFSTLLSPRRPQDFNNMAAERGNSFLDRRHRFTFNWVYDTPWYRTSSNLLARYALGGYTLSGTYTFESPQPVTLQSGTDSNLNGDSAGDRVILNPDGTRNVGSAVTGIDKNGNGLTAGDPNIVAYVAKNSSAEYVVAGQGAIATVGRNTFTMRPINNWDVQVKKEFTIKERYKLQFAGQFFNLFNHPQYVPGYINNVQFHTSYETRNQLIPGNALFNQPDQVYSSNSRTIQVTGRFEF